jgi:hypothetical protein
MGIAVIGISSCTAFDELSRISLPAELSRCQAPSQKGRKSSYFWRDLMPHLVKQLVGSPHTAGQGE